MQSRKRKESDRSLSENGPGWSGLLSGEDGTIDDGPALGELNVLRWQRLSYLSLVLNHHHHYPPPPNNDGIISTPEPDLTLTPDATHKSPNADLSHLNTTPFYPDRGFARLGRGWRTLFRSRICQRAQALCPQPYVFVERERDWCWSWSAPIHHRGATKHISPHGRR
jgi:hypothetical protein